MRVHFKINHVQNKNYISKARDYQLYINKVVLLLATKPVYKRYVRHYVQGQEGHNTLDGAKYKKFINNDHSIIFIHL